MQAPMLTGPRYRQLGFILCVIVAALLSAAAAFAFAAQDPSFPGLILAAGMMILVSAVYAVWIHRRRIWILVTEDGFEITDRRGCRTYRDADVISYCLSHKNNYSNGALKSVTRKFELWIDRDGEIERILLTNRLLNIDPLGEFIERVVNRIEREAERILSEGGSYVGQGWAIHPNSLELHGPPQRELRFDELAAVDVFDNQVCVWEVNRDEPTARIPLKSANSLLLIQLLRARIPERSIAPPEDGRLGRALFRRGRLSCHEHGIARKGWFGREVRMRYAEMDSFTFSATRLYINGAYSGTTLAMSFISHAGGERRKIAHSATVRNADEELDNLRDFVSSQIAARLHERLAAGESVQWTAQSTFTPEGLEYRPSGFLRRKEWRFAPYGEISYISLEDGTFRLFLRGESAPEFTEKATAENFFPGYFLLCVLLTPRPAESVA